jgi:NAD(P)-dependent dehydrogenase (short-subunit alcohol dehydrogenase family)
MPGAALPADTPAGIVGQAQDIASAAVVLAGDEARFIQGTVIDVDGGRIGVAVIAA